MLSRAQRGARLCATWCHWTQRRWICFHDGASQSGSSPCVTSLRWLGARVLDQVSREAGSRRYHVLKPEPRNWTVTPLHPTVPRAQTQIPGAGTPMPSPPGRSPKKPWVTLAPSFLSSLHPAWALGSFLWPSGLPHLPLMFHHQSCFIFSALSHLAQPLHHFFKKKTF